MDRNQLTTSRLFILFLSASVALAPLSIDMYMPAMAQMAEQFKVDFSEVNLTMSAYLFGNALGQFFGGALSDQIGRRKIGIAGFTIFFFASLAIASVDDIQHMQLLRIAQAVGGGFATVICIAQIRDIFPVEQVMKRYSDVVVVMMIAPIVAPTLGVGLIQFGWQSIFYVLAAISLFMLITYVLAIPETKTNVVPSINIKRLFSGYWAVMNHRNSEGRITAIRYALYGGFNLGVFMCIITNVAMIFMQNYQFSELSFALGFASIGLAMIAGNRIAVRVTDKIVAEKWLQYATSMQIVCASLLVALSMANNLSWQLAAGLISVIVMMNGSIVPTTSARFISFFDEHAGSAASLSTTLSFGFGAIIGAIAAVLSRDSITPVFATMLVSAIIALCIQLTIDPIPLTKRDSHEPS